MRKVFIASFVLLTLLVPMLFAAGGPAEDKAIRDRLDEFQSGWNKNDTTAMAALWTDDGTLINPFGVSAQGREAIVKVFIQEHAGVFKGSTYKTSDVKVQWATPDVAIADLTANISGVHTPDGATAPDFPHHVTWVFVKKDGKWLAAAARPYQFSKQ